MRLPPADLLRDEPPPDDLLHVVRGGVTTLSDAHLANQVGDCWDRHAFFGVSVFGAPGDDLTAVSGAMRAIRVQPVVRVARCGALRAAELEVLPTFANPVALLGRAARRDAGDVPVFARPLRRPRPEPGPRLGRVIARTMGDMKQEPIVELWVDDHAEYEPGIVTGHLRHARMAIDPHPGDYLVVGDDEIAPALALVVSRDADGTIRLRILPGPATSHAEHATRRLPTLAS